MKNNNLKVSLITVSLNSEKTIKETLNSIENQSYQNIEHIIIDGISTDKTLDIINDYSLHKSNIKILSEKDKGIFDAMNKGIKLSNGEIIGILNSDDMLFDSNVVQNIVKKFNDTNADVIYSDIIMVDRENIKKVKRKWIAKEGNINYGWLPPHTGMFYKKHLLRKMELFNLNFGTASDTDFIIRIFKKKQLIISYLEDYTVKMRLGGVSTKNLTSLIKNYKRSVEIYKSNNIAPSFIIALLKIIRKVKQYFFRKVK